MPLTFVEQSQYQLQNKFGMVINIDKLKLLGIIYTNTFLNYLKTTKPINKYFIYAAQFRAR